MGTLVGLLVLSGWVLSTEERIELETQHTAAGWGYRIKQNSRVMIDQPTIPAISGTKGFATRQNAQRAGELVVSKIRAGRFPPSLTPHELDSLGVLP